MPILAIMMPHNIMLLCTTTMPRMDTKVIIHSALRSTIHTVLTMFMALMDIHMVSEETTRDMVSTASIKALESMLLGMMNSYIMDSTGSMVMVTTMIIMVTVTVDMVQVITTQAMIMDMIIETIMDMVMMTTAMAMITSTTLMILALNMVIRASMVIIATADIH